MPARFWEWAYVCESEGWSPKVFFLLFSLPGFFALFLSLSFSLRKRLFLSFLFFNLSFSFPLFSPQGDEEAAERGEWRWVSVCVWVLMMTDWLKRVNQGSSQKSSWTPFVHCTWKQQIFNQFFSACPGQNFAGLEQQPQQNYYWLHLLFPGPRRHRHRKRETAVNHDDDEEPCSSLAKFSHMPQLFYHSDCHFIDFNYQRWSTNNIRFQSPIYSEESKCS